ncbi:MAG: hypothetical protein GKR94_04640 [Gammaproteobacteria bacterium]|nr:hypothetical protein [Gammaproteobacteria bacterium]
MLLATGAVSAAVESLSVSEPRAFGYVIGDRVQHQLRLQLNKPYRLARDALPPSGKAGRWFTRMPLTISSEEQEQLTFYRIDVRHQLTNVPSTVAAIEIPELTLWITDGTQRLPLTVPATSIVAAPLTPLGERAQPGQISLRPDQAPFELPLAGHLWRAGAVAAVLLLALCYLLYAHAAVPWLARSRGPFARACRQLSRLQRQDNSAATYRQALRAVHTAVNDTAGCVIFARDLAVFFARHPQFAPLREAIENVFAQSRSVFFRAAVPRREPSIAALHDICRRCRDAERGL